MLTSGDKMRLIKEWIEGDLSNKAMAELIGARE